MSQLVKHEIIIFALALIILLCVVLYYLTLQALLEKDLVLLLKFLPFATLCFYFFVKNFPELFISKNIIQFLTLIAIPILICFFIYAQKSFVVLYYGLMLGILSAIYCLNFNGLNQLVYLCLVALIFIGSIVILKLSLKNQLVLDSKFYWGLLMMPLAFVFTFWLVGPGVFQDPTTLKVSQNFWVKIPHYITSHYMLFCVFSVTLSIPFIWYSYSIIRDADCFSEKIFASLALPFIVTILIMIQTVTLWEELVFLFCFYWFF
jgi:hypothetical protein